MAPGEQKEEGEYHYIPSTSTPRSQSLRFSASSVTSLYATCRLRDQLVQHLDGHFQSLRLLMQRLLQFVVSFLALLVAVVRANDLCNFTAVIDVANEFYPGCRDLYNVLEQSVPVNYTSSLCGDSDCLAAMDKLRSMDLGDCFVFGSTTLTSDILDQCKGSKSTAWVGWVLFAVTVLVFIPVVIYRLQYYRAQKAQTQLDLANGKLGINDAPYKAVDLASTRV